MKPRFPANLFAGTADEYIRYRVPYPDSLIRDLLGRVPANGHGLLVDLGCGPGRLTFCLAPHFATVRACDLEPGMIAAAQVESRRRGFSQIHWEVGLAEELTIAPGSVELVAIGEAFHRFNQPAVIAAAARWLRPGGAIATVGSYILADRNVPWQRSVLEVVAQFEQSRPATFPAASEMGPAHDETLFRNAGFTDVKSHPFVTDHTWTAESILGYLRSTSFASRARLGNRADEFAQAIGRALEPHLVDGVIHDRIQFGYTFARKV
ncbi:MAG TPA: class I SAM-dependent methyltransferase [Candidatus Didemnitutus sp.]|nr:class I SAM-dependent methyltransferase [Candidatus Didemnitutus sp.]